MQRGVTVGMQLFLPCWALKLLIPNSVESGFIFFEWWFTFIIYSEKKLLLANFYLAYCLWSQSLTGISLHIIHQGASKYIRKWVTGCVSRRPEVVSWIYPKYLFIYFVSFVVTPRICLRVLCVEMERRSGSPISQTRRRLGERFKVLLL